MFSSNQVLSISGSLADPDEIKEALKFALKVERGHLNKRSEDKIVYQIAGNKFCIGWFYDKPEEGWQKFQFDFDADIVSRIIQQFLAKQDWIKSGYEGADGSLEKGFIMKCFSYEEFNNDEIKNSDYGIVYFEPFTCFYAK